MIRKGEDRSMKEKTLFDNVVEYYARHKCNPGTISQDEYDSILEAFRKKVLEDAIPQFEKEEWEKAKARVEAEVKAYKRKALQNLKRSLIIDAILVAFLVGIIVNQVTTLIPEAWYCCLGVILVSFGACVLLVILGTAEPEE